MQHGACVGEADEHVRRGRGPVQAVQLVPYVVRGHDGAAGVSERLDAMQNETKTLSFLFPSLILFVLRAQDES